MIDEYMANINTKEYWDTIWENELIDMKIEKIDINNSHIRHNVHRYKPYIYEIILKYIKDNDSILDIGCGVGIFLNYIKGRRKNLRLYGMDISSYAIHKLKSTGIDGEVYRIPDKVGKLIWPGKGCFGGSFDVVVSIEVLEHMTCEECLLEHMVYFCKKDGVCILTVPTDKKSSCGEHINVYDVNRLDRLLRLYWDNVNIIQLKGMPNFMAVMHE